jgi:two-component system chemotaxis sensor kinase CheA
LTAVRESIAPEKGQIRTLAGGQEIMMLRGQALPIVRLSRLLRLRGGAEDIERSLLIHVAARDRRFCIAVDRLVGQRQTVVKALPGMMGQVPGISSCSILEDGGIGLILDVAGLVDLINAAGRGEAAGEAGESGEAGAAERNAA